MKLSTSSPSALFSPLRTSAPQLTHDITPFPLLSPADISTPAHYFMLKKDESGYSAGTYAHLLSDGLNTSLGTTIAAANGMPAPGQPYRWMLPDNPTGMHGLANLYNTMDKMMAVYTGYTFLQV